MVRTANLAHCVARGPVRGQVAGASTRRLLNGGCPLADAGIKTRSPLRNEGTIKLAGGRTGLFIAPSVADEIRDMRDHAERFRRLASVVEDERNRLQLLDMASELDRGADALEEANKARKR